MRVTYEGRACLCRGSTEFKHEGIGVCAVEVLWANWLALTEFWSEGFVDMSKVRILLCDKDGERSLELLLLLRNCSYHVTSVRSAIQASDALNAEGLDFDIILAEVDLPMRKGMKMLNYITRDKELRRILVIMMSALDEFSIVVKCFRLGDDDYLVKPLHTNELLNLWRHRCMFGDTEVLAYIIQEGVIRCEAPPQLPGKVTFCITSGNRESCSEVREFEYRVKSTISPISKVQFAEGTKNPEELLLVRFAHILLYGISSKNERNMEPDNYMFRHLKEADDSWNRIIETLLMSCRTSLKTINSLIEELLKYKLQNNIANIWKGPNQASIFLFRKEQCIIHMVAGLGFEWASTPVLSMGVNINFRDFNGWTALHWAARYGREKMGAILIVFGALAGAVTDPTSEDPIRKTPATITSISEHKGLANSIFQREP